MQKSSSQTKGVNTPIVSLQKIFKLSGTVTHLHSYTLTQLHKDTITHFHIFILVQFLDKNQSDFLDII